jgi:PAS domain S-box-containing protein
MSAQRPSIAYHRNQACARSIRAIRAAHLYGLLHSHQYAKEMWMSAQFWLTMYTFAPPWLPRRWRNPFIGYLVAIILQVLLAGGDLILMLRYPDLSTHHLPLALGVMIIALNWGVGPSLVATITGVILLYSVVLFTPLSWMQATETDLAELFLFLLICGSITALSSQTQRARLHAERARRAAEHLAASLVQEHASSELERQRLQAVLEVLPIGVCLVNAAGHVLAQNQAERAIWGATRSETPGPYGLSHQGWRADTGHRLRPGDWALARALAQGREIRGDEIVIQMENGSRRTFLNAAVPVHDTTGNIVGAVAALLDITERKQLEKTLRQAEREQLVREREEAEAAARALSETNRRMDIFLGIASHELKTPLTTTRLHLQLLHRRIARLLSQRLETGENIARELEHLREQCRLGDLQADRLNSLVDDLLDVSRIQAGRLELRPEQVDLAAIIRETVEQQQILNPQRQLHIQGLAEEPLFVHIDAERVRQVLTNYLTNALKYSPEDRPVEVGVEMEPAQTLVWVRDEGPGIPPAEQTQMWERFYRVPGIEVQSGSGIGLGLGLYICQTIIERQGGQVGVESIPGAGSTFWFTLPLTLQKSTNCPRA